MNETHEEFDCEEIDVIEVMVADGNEDDHASQADGCDDYDDDYDWAETYSLEATSIEEQARQLEEETRLYENKLKEVFAQLAADTQETELSPSQAQQEADDTLSNPETALNASPDTNIDTDAECNMDDCGIATEKEAMISEQETKAYEAYIIERSRALIEKARKRARRTREKKARAEEARQVRERSDLRPEQSGQKADQLPDTTLQEEESVPEIASEPDVMGRKEPSLQTEEITETTEETKVVEEIEDLVSDGEKLLEQKEKKNVRKTVKRTPRPSSSKRTSKAKPK